ncbi:zinc transporter 2 [Nilaparvata lugens]|uniref:zinc transporter 2 n=1 Tax=Nilaparvata lugens TaxID=108931 RepID=UPI00193D9D6A|nr:zinc transporter 2 [Nilaparvata lugens]
MSRVSSKVDFHCDKKSEIDCFGNDNESNGVESKRTANSSWRHDIPTGGEPYFEDDELVQNHFMQKQTSTNSSVDGADIPLLNDVDGFNHQMLEDTTIDHCHIPLTTQCKVAYWKLMSVAATCLLFMTIEIIGGHLAGSIAIMGDAAHLFSDFISFVISLFAIWIGQQNPTKHLTFGFQRVEVIAVLFSVAVIWILSAYFMYVSVIRIMHKDFVIDSNKMLFVSLFGIVSNLVMGVLLHSYGEDLRHCHSHNSPDNMHNNLKAQNINIRAAIIHVIGDLVQSVGVLVSACIIHYYPNAKIADPICTLIFSMLVICTTMSVIIDSLWILLEGLPPHLDYASVRQSLAYLEGVQTVHSLHIWTLTSSQYVATAHLTVDNVDRDVLLERARSMLRLKFGIERITIQVEQHRPQAYIGCDQCKYPLL